MPVYCFTIDVITHVVLYNSLLMHIILSHRSEVKGENPVKLLPIYAHEKCV